MLKRTRTFFVVYWQACTFYGGLLTLFGGLLWLRLGTLTHGFSAAELASQNAAANLHQLLRQPLNAPYYLLVRGLEYLAPHHKLLAVRLASAVLGLITITMFYWLVRYWHGSRAAVFGTILFGASAWFLHTSRLGTPDVMLFGLLGLTACGLWFKHSGKPWAVMIIMVLAAVFLYVPGMVWFIAAGVAWQWRTIDRVFKKHLAMVTTGGFLLLGALAPLGWAIYKTPELAKVLAGLPAHGWPQPMVALRALAEVPVNLFFRGPLQPEHWLGRTAILDVFSVAMLFLGGYAYLKHIRLARAKLLLAIILMGAVLVALGGAVTLSILMPFVYVMVAAGIGILCDRWFAVFPRNTIAQSAGILLISLAVATACWYSLKHYFTAWPAASSTHSLFIVQETPPSATINKK